MTVQCGVYSTNTSSLHHSIKVAGGAKRYCKPVSFEQKLEARKQGFAYHEQTRTFIKQKNLEEQKYADQRAQDKLFAQYFGGTAQQLGTSYDPGDPYLASISYGIVGGASNSDQTFLRPDQIQAIQAARRGQGGLAGPIPSSAMPSRSAGSAGALRIGPGASVPPAPAPFSEQFGLSNLASDPIGVAKRNPLLVIGAAIAAIYLFGK